MNESLADVKPSDSSTAVLHFECLSGISGDMTLGALIDIGASLDAIQSGVRSMGLPDLSVTAAEVKKAGFRAQQITIAHPPESAHRHLHHIEAMIDGATEIDDAAKTLAKAIFHRIAVAEAKVHGTTLKKVHFHEVGAIDSIADIVGVAIAVTSLQISAVTSSPIPTGHGEITIDHGRVPLPAPATAEILCGFPVAPTNIPYELTTPTGAAIITTLTECFGDGIGSFGPPPSMIPHRIGYGAGTRDLEGQANVLRITLGHRHEQSIAPEITMAGIDSDRVALIETNLDDADPQMIAGATQRLLNAGALDVWQTPCVMKKGRLATVVSVLASTELAPTIQTILLTHTTSIGVRRHFVERAKLPRRDHHVDTDLGRVPGKLVTLPDGGMRWKPDDDAIRNLTEKTGQSSHTLHSVAQTQFQSSSQSDLETQ